MHSVGKYENRSSAIYSGIGEIEMQKENVYEVLYTGICNEQY